MSPKVSVIVPVYKAEKYLNRCVDSLINQTLEDIEIILVDDESPDNSPAICDDYAKVDSRVKVIHKKNAGAGMARNSALEIATGEYVGFTDSDDYVDCQMFEALYSAAKKYEAELVVSGARFVGGNVFAKEGADEEKNCFDEETYFPEDKIKDLLLGVVGALPHEPEDSRYGTSVWKNLYKRDVIEKNNIKFLSEREIMSEDALFTIDFIHHIKSAVGIPGVYYNYFRNEGSISKSYKKDRLEQNLVYLKAVEDRIKNDVSADEYKIYLDRVTQGYARVLCSQEIMYARENGLSFFELRKNLKKICTSQEIENALKHYPWYKLPIKQAVFAFTMKYKLYLLQKIVVVLRDL